MVAEKANKLGNGAAPTVARKPDLSTVLEDDSSAEREADELPEIVQRDVTPKAPVRVVNKTAALREAASAEEATPAISKPNNDQYAKYLQELYRLACANEAAFISILAA